MPAIGLYIHIPFCTSVCHYCDFAKTARYGDSEREQYLRALIAEWKDWSAWCQATWGDAWSLDSCYFGGGTPSVYGPELEPLMAEIRSKLIPGAEVTFEANPEHISPGQLLAWRDMGINRLSLGVQSFDATGLKFLTRHHSPDQAEAAIQQALAVFSNVNVDLIYGWPGQTNASWRDEVRRVAHSGATHSSYYILTYAPGTPHGRRAARGMLHSEDDSVLEARYGIAREEMERGGFVHEEVSNWAKDQRFAVHNAKYWRQQYYLALGMGGHGFLPSGDSWGWRFSHKASVRGYLDGLTRQPINFTGKKASLEWQDELVSKWHLETDERTKADWLTESLVSGLRSHFGIDLQDIQRQTGQVFKPTPFLTEQVAQGSAVVLEQQTLKLLPAEWFRETAWCHEINKAFDL